MFALWCKSLYCYLLLRSDLGVNWSKTNFKQSLKFKHRRNKPIMLYLRTETEQEVITFTPKLTTVR